MILNIYLFLNLWHYKTNIFLKIMCMIDCYRMKGNTSMSNETEAQIQKRLSTHLDSLNLLWTATANGGKRDKRTASSLKAQGVKRGVPDILIFTPPINGGGVGFAIELKVPASETRRKGKVSEHQRVWMQELRSLGWRAEIAYGFDHAVELLEKAGYTHE
jgi:hypothetical protein